MIARSGSAVGESRNSGWGVAGWMGVTVVRTRLVALLVLVALAAAACGGSADEAGTDAASSGSAEEAATDEAPTDAAPSGSADDAATDPASNGDGSEQGGAAFEGEFPTLDGGSIDLASFEGQDVVLWFWAPW